MNSTLNEADLFNIHVRLESRTPIWTVGNLITNCKFQTCKLFGCSDLWPLFVTVTVPSQSRVGRELESYYNWRYNKLITLRSFSRTSTYCTSSTRTSLLLCVQYCPPVALIKNSSWQLCVLQILTSLGVSIYQWSLGLSWSSFLALLLCRVVFSTFSSVTSCRLL